MIEAEVFGDPEATRALANELTGRADLVAAMPAGFSVALDVATFEGGAADRIRGASATARGGILGAVAELRGIASALFADASVIEQQNADTKAAAEAAQQAADESESHGPKGGASSSHIDRAPGAPRPR